MTWIQTIPDGEAEEGLQKLYDRIRAPGGQIDNIMLAHSLRPHSLEGHMTLYKGVLHHPRNEIPKWFLEAIGVLVSQLNGCHYCRDHHFQGLARLVNDASRSQAIDQAFRQEDWTQAFNGKEAAALTYAFEVTNYPGECNEGQIIALRNAGWSDGEILEINQVVAYFSYANRTVQGLGINTEGEVIGLSPGTNADPEDWSHG